MRKVTSFLLLIALSFLFYIVYVSGTHAADTKDQTTAGLYKQNCAKCHGEQGKGDGPAAKTIKNMKMADWTDKEVMSKFTDDELFKITSEGSKAVGKSNFMPGYKSRFKEKEIRDLAAYVRSFAKK